MRYDWTCINIRSVINDLAISCVFMVLNVMGRTQGPYIV